MVEGVVVMPFFILLLAAVMYFHHAFAAKMQSSVKARSCAWDYSLAGCVAKTSTLKGCHIGNLTSGADALQSIGSDSSVSKETKDAFGHSSGNGDGLDGALAGANRVGLAMLGLREGVVSRPSTSVRVPSLLGGGTRRISGDYSVMCNERKMSFLEIGQEAYCALGDHSPMPGCGDR